MKYSQFNSIIKFDNEFALYNSFNHKVIFIVPELKDLLEAAIREEIDELANYHLSFYQHLVENDFLIDASTNEVEKVKQLVKSIDTDESQYSLTINPTMNCNFKCWYCYETHIKDSKMDENGIEKVEKFIQKTAKKPIERFYLAFFGGEPLLHFEKNVAPLITSYLDTCTKNNIQHHISFTTNGYLINTKLIAYFDSKKVKCAFQITLDGHKEDHDAVRNVNSKRGSYDKIIENIYLLLENHFHVRVRINYTDQNIAKAINIIDDFISLTDELKKNHLVIDFHRVWQNQDGLNVDSQFEKVVTAFIDNGFFVQTKYSINTVLDSCYADKKNSVTVNYNGDIYKCTARDFTKKNREGYIDSDGNLIWENDNLNKRMQIKFNNKPCLTCRILPLCNGGCSQAAIEHKGEDYCVHNWDETEKDKIVLKKVIEIREHFLQSNTTEHSNA